MSLTSKVICNICKLFLENPVALPCGCLICNEHVLTNLNITITCLTCGKEFSTSKRFIPNELAQTIIDEDLHLQDEKKSLKQPLTKIIFDLEKLIEEFKYNHGNFELTVHERFVEIRRKIDTQREELKKKIDDIALEMIDQTKERENTLISNLKEKYLNLNIPDVIGRKQEKFN